MELASSFTARGPGTQMASSPREGDWLNQMGPVMGSQASDEYSNAN